MPAHLLEGIKTSTEKAVSFVEWLVVILRGTNWVKKLLLLDVVLFVIFNPISFPGILKSITQQQLPNHYRLFFWLAIGLVFIAAVIVALHTPPHKIEATPRKVGRFPGALPSAWKVPHIRNPNFIGRDTLLDKVRASLISGHPAALIQTITGLGGVGKTQLAVEYAYRYNGKYEVVWWVRAEERAELASDYAGLARALALPANTSAGRQEIIDLVRQWLGEHSDWLLIFDNACDAASVSPFLPQGATGHCIITSRNPNWSNLGQSISIDTLKREDSTSFLLGATRQSDERAAMELAGALGDLPLALAQAAAYVERASMTLSAYLALFRTRRKNLWQDAISPLGYPDTVATTWSLGIERVATESPAAKELAELCSYLGPDAIPFTLLQQGKSYLTPSLSTLATDPVKWNSALAALRSYSLIEVYEQTISLHRLVQAVIRDRLPQENAKAWAARAVGMVKGGFPLDSDEQRNSDACSRLLSHALVAARHAHALKVEAATTSTLLNNVGLFLKTQGDYDAAQTCLEGSLTIGDTEYDQLR